MGGKKEDDEEKDQAKDLSMDSMHQKGLRKKRDDDDNSEGKGGVTGSGSQDSGGPVGRQQTSTKSEAIPPKSRQDGDQPPFKVIYKVNYTHCVETVYNKYLKLNHIHNGNRPHRMQMKN